MPCFTLTDLLFMALCGSVVGGVAVALIVGALGTLTWGEG